MTICLNMIVKNEAPVIARCLDSVRAVIDHWIIVDTGSTDGTQDIIRRTMAGVPGALYERPWRDFATNRNEALVLAQPHADYLLFIDADDVLMIDPGFRPPPLVDDAYDVENVADGVHYTRPHIVRSALRWRWHGVLHEYLACDKAKTHGTISELRVRRNHDGARRRAGDTYQRDAVLLEAALRTESDPFMRSRYTFYLAQSYRDGGDKPRALQAYLKRAELGFWAEEVFVSLLYAGRFMEALGSPVEETLRVYQRASAACPTRVEALVGASQLCFRNGRYSEGSEIAKRGLSVQVPSKALFLELRAYEYGLLDVYAANAFQAGAYRECLDACLTLLKGGKLPQSEHERVLANAHRALDRMPHTPGLGTRGAEGLVKQHALVQERPLRSRLTRHPRVMLAILAKQKEQALPLYLACIEALDYPKSSIVLYIRTNNNTDGTEGLLRAWLERVGSHYAAVEFDPENVPEPVEQFAVHEWNAMRFRVLGRIRNISLRRALETDCDFYFVCDVDNFVRPATLRELVALDLPIVAPLLRSIDPRQFYSNYHAELDANGYYKECDQYHWILNRWVCGVIELPLVHCTYLVRADVLNDLTYEDGTDRYEYVVFAHSARKSGVPQYIDNRQIYGYVTFDASGNLHVAGGVARARALLEPELRRRHHDENLQSTRANL